ncbi:hypothetical protein T11_1548 [Trichinella zimbabwensis]|uniref:Uncharacterized protein n=1 Tax=Trichinella zimbabwensis TaxID=268475 RepID=A0A0V1HZS4_9BILA|nr:hypothetical protein T11_1548 [Trichinella zimbabwensis]
MHKRSFEKRIPAKSQLSQRAKDCSADKHLEEAMQISMLYNEKTSKASGEIETPGTFSCVLQCIHAEQEDTPLQGNHNIKYKL